MSKKKIEVVIDRAKWRTGQDNENSTGKGPTELLNKQGFKCCLGFLSCAVRGPRDKIQGKAYPSDCSFNIPELIENNRDSELTLDAICINDNESTTLKEKEIALKKLFKDSGYKLVFKGKSVKYRA